MNKRYFAFFLCLSVLLFGFGSFPRKPKLVSSVFSMDTAYLTVLADEREVREKDKFRQKLWKMCVEDTFSEMKLQTEKRGLPGQICISVYVTKKDLENGSPYTVIRYDGEKR